MLENQHHKIQRDLENLSVILEHWLPLLNQMQTIQENLCHLPIAIDNLDQYSNQINIDKAQVNSNKAAISREISQLEISHKLGSLLNSLDTELPLLVDLEEKINNLITLRKIIEVVQ